MKRLTGTERKGRWNSEGFLRSFQISWMYDMASRVLIFLFNVLFVYLQKTSGGRFQGV